MKKRLVVLLMVCIFIVCMLGGCAELSNLGNTAKEGLTGTRFTASSYDFYGNNTMNLSGKSVSLDVLDSSSSLFASDTATTYTSSVLDVTIDGNQAIMVGDTFIFAEDGLDMVTDFNVDDLKDIESSGGGTGFQPLDRLVNKYKNSIGKSKTIVISTQAGVPIKVYQGAKVYVEVPSDLPKTTRLSIDGKMLYIHRANYMIIDTKLLK